METEKQFCIMTNRETVLLMGMEIPGETWKGLKGETHLKRRKVFYEVSLTPDPFGYVTLFLVSMCRL